MYGTTLREFKQVSFGVYGRVVAANIYRFTWYSKLSLSGYHHPVRVFCPMMLVPSVIARIIVFVPRV